MSDKACTMIWSGEHHAWWNPSCAGYTADVNSGGRWTHEEAERITATCGAEKKIKLIRIASEWVNGVKI